MDTFKSISISLICIVLLCNDVLSQDTLFHQPKKLLLAPLFGNDSILNLTVLKKRSFAVVPIPRGFSNTALAGFRKPISLLGGVNPLHQPLVKASNIQIILDYSSYTGSFSNSSFSSDVAVSGVPVNASFHSAIDDLRLKDRVNFSSFKFDKEEYVKGLQEQLKKISNGNDIFKGYLKKLYEGRDAAVVKMRTQMGGLLGNAKSKYSKAILDKFNVENLSKEDPSQLLQHIINNQAGMINERRAILERITKGSGPMAQDSILILKKDINELSASNDLLINSADTLEQGWAKNGIIQTIRGFEKNKGQAIKELLEKPEVVAELAEKHLHINGLKKMLLNLRSLKTGASGSEHNDLIQGQNILKGVTLDYLKKGKSVMPVLGSIQGIQNINDLSYSNFSELANTFTSGLRMGKGNEKTDYSQVSFFMFQARGNGIPGGDMQQSFSKNFVFSVSRKISFGEAHILQADVSKSTMIYSSALQGEKDNLAKGLAGQGFFDNMGIDLNYQGDFKSIGLQNDLVIRYKGNEYTSLGNSFAVNGAKEISNSVRKAFYGRRLLVTLKGQMREYSLGSSDSKWRNMSYVADVKMKYKKGEFIELRVQPSVSKRIEPTLTYIASRSGRLSLRGNINRKVGRGFTYRNYIELTSVKDAFTDRTNLKNNSAHSLIVTSLQNIQVGKKNIFINTVLNRAKNNSGYVLFNSSVNVDAGTIYTIKNLINLSSSLAYNHTDMLYTQISLRQSASAEIGKKVSVSGYINAGKNIKQYSSFYMPEISGTFSIRYTLN